MKKILLLVAGLAITFACTKKVAELRPSQSTNAKDQVDNPNESDAQGPTLVCDGQSETVYKGFGDRNLTAGRLEKEDIPILGDRYRIKPYEVLESEYQRVTGILPTSLARAAATFRRSSRKVVPGASGNIGISFHNL